MIGSFILPANGVWTPEEVERRRKMADALDEQGQINGPIRTPLEGFGKLANALMGGFVRSQADKTEKKSRSNAFSAMTNALVSGGMASSQPVAASPANTKGADPGIVAYIREAAVKRGINPDIAVRVAMSEGLKANPADGWQSNVAKNGRRERSFWPYQLYMDGGLGNEFAKKEGFDPNSFDPNAPGLLNKSIDFALDKARQGGWGPWNGAKAIGLDQWAGIDRNAPAMAQGQPQPQPGAPQAQPANYTPSQDGGMVQQAQTGNRMQQLQSLIMSQDFQWLPPEQQQFVMQAYEAERAAMNPDPMKQLQMQKLQAEIAGMGQAKPTDDMREYEFAKSQGFQGTFQDFMLQMKKAGAPSVNNNIMAGEKSYEVERAKGFAGRAAEIDTAEQSATKALTALDVMERQMTDKDFYSGFGSGGILAARRAIVALGGDPNQVSSMEGFSAQAKQLAIDSMGGSLGTGFSNADRDFVTGQVAGLENTPQGNRALIDVSRRINKRKVEIARMARDYEMRNGRLDPKFFQDLSMWAEQNPIFPDASAPQGDVKAPAEMSDEELMRALGGQ